MKVRVQLGAGSKQTLGGPAGISIALHLMLFALAIFPLGFTKSKPRGTASGGLLGRRRTGRIISPRRGRRHRPSPICS